MTDSINKNGFYIFNDDKINWKPSFWILILPFTAMVLVSVFHIPIIGGYLYQLLAQLVLFITMFILLLIQTIAALYFAIKRRWKAVFSFAVGICLLAFGLLGHHLVNDLLWHVRLIIYHNHYAQCIKNAVPIGEGTAIGFCDGTGYALWSEAVIYDSSGQISLSTDETSDEWKYAALKAGAIGTEADIYHAKLLSGKFYNLTINNGDGTDPVINNFYNEHNCTGQLEKLVCH